MITVTNSGPVKLVYKGRVIRPGQSVQVHEHDYEHIKALIDQVKPETSKPGKEKSDAK